MTTIGRRELLVALGGAAAAWPLAARAQQALPVIGFLHTESADRSRDRLRGFHQGLGEIGYVEGRNITIEYRWAEDHNDRFPALAADLVRRQVAVIVANAAAAPAAKAATSKIPIVFVSGIDPVALGLVSSLNRPGGNLTGVSQMNVQLGPKRVQLLHEAMPAATTARRRIASFALVSRLPTVYTSREHVEEGGLISYGVDLHQNYRRAAYFVDKILKGEKPGDLPIEFPTKVELVVNATTAKAIGVTIPPTLLARADEVIE
jgi:putative ABC transport system substrate-binding protein